MYDFAIWREQVETIEDLGAAVSFERALRVDGEGVEPVAGAEISASAFRLARISPVLGRTLIERDELPSEPPVAVISHSLWHKRFAADPQVVGRAIELGATSATVVGVMPEGFGFPVSQRIWTPLRLDGAAVAPRSGPHVQMFGRLTKGATLQEAETELAAISQPRVAVRANTRVPTLAQRIASSATKMPLAMVRIRITTSDSPAGSGLA